MGERLSLTHGPDELRQYLAAFAVLPFMSHTGIRVELADDERVRAIIDPLEPVHRGGIQGSAANGGVLASVFDLCLGLPGLLRAYPQQRTATVQLSMSFLRALRGDRLECEGWIVRAGKSVLFTAAEIRDGAGELCAAAQGVVRVMDAHGDAKQF